MNITWIILLLVLLRGNNGCCAKDCEKVCDSCDKKKDCDCYNKKPDYDCCNKKPEKNDCGCSVEQSSPFPVFNGTGAGNTSGCGCDS